MNLTEIRHTIADTVANRLDVFGYAWPVRPAQLPAVVVRPASTWVTWEGFREQEATFVVFLMLASESDAAAYTQFDDWVERWPGVLAALRAAGVNLSTKGSIDGPFAVRDEQGAPLLVAEVSLTVTRTV